MISQSSLNANVQHFWFKRLVETNSPFIAPKLMSILVPASGMAEAKRHNLNIGLAPRQANRNNIKIVLTPLHIDNERTAV